MLVHPFYPTLNPSTARRCNITFAIESKTFDSSIDAANTPSVLYIHI